ncbi:glycoside hydrolase family 76 protein [Edaphobacter sp. 4G125]|nr:glycoside hydrolase family 76 protein [Edaphobacter sp. 4G125]
MLHRAQLAVDALQQWYVPRTGLYRTTGWWNSANAITAITGFMRMSGSRKYVSVLSHTYATAQVPVPKEQQTVEGKEMTGFPGFLNKYYDDEGWWALAWIDAYDLTHDARYLTMAESIFADMAGGWDATCGGGIWWSKDRTYKNAIANELFLSVAAHLATRSSEDRDKYAGWAAKEWQWFRQSGMINSENLINDGLTIDAKTGACRNNQKTVWSYNQGVILGGLAEWSRHQGNAAVLDDARKIADAALAHLGDGEGVLHDVCEPKCGADAIQFKGIFVRNLRALDTVAPEPRYAKAFRVNAGSIWTKNRTPQNTFGVTWSGPPEAIDAGTQSSALDALVAALPHDSAPTDVEKVAEAVK